MIERSVEAGLVNQWFQDLISEASRQKSGNNRDSSYYDQSASKVLQLFDLQVKIISLYNPFFQADVCLQGAFIFISIGWSLAIIVLLGEILSGRI